MPVYEFELEDGGTADEYFLCENRPKLGALVTLASGKKGRRIMSGLNGFARRDVRFVCMSAPRVWEGEGPDPAPRRNARGQPVIHSRKEAIAFGQATGGFYDEL